MDPPHLLGFDVFGQLESNTIHLRRFANKYGQAFQSKFGIDLDQFKSLDVIDLNILNEIRISDKNHLKQYKIFDIGRNDISVAGTGLSVALCDHLEDGKFYYLLIDNSHYHRIRADSHTTLVVDTEVCENLKTAPEKNDLLFLKFNKVGLRRYTRDILIDKLQ